MQTPAFTQTCFRIVIGVVGFVSLFLSSLHSTKVGVHVISVTLCGRSLKMVKPCSGAQGLKSRPPPPTTNESSVFPHRAVHPPGGVTAARWRDVRVVPLCPPSLATLGIIYLH